MTKEEIKLRIAYVQMKVSAGHPDVNTKKILKFIDEARAGGADMIIFPKFAVSGLMLGDVWNQNSFRADCTYYGEEIIAASQNIVVVFGNAHRVLGGNFSHVARNGKLIELRDYSTGIDVKLGKKTYRVEIKVGDEETFVQHLDKKYGGKKYDFAIKSSMEPFYLEKNILDNKIPDKFPLIYVDCVGIQNTGKTLYTFDGSSAVFNSRGEIVQLAEPFEECLNFIELDEIDKMPALELPEVSETEKIYRAISYGVKSFLEQIGMKKIVIGVSGGIDSAVAAALYTKVLGAENVVLVNMPSVFNSDTTKNLSEQLAKNLGCKYYVVPIQESVDWTVKQLTERGIEVSSFVKENIQARDRSSRILAAIAASIGGGFTCNANKAETTVGYATLYGDEAGFLSALADLWKYQVYDLARYMNEEIFKHEVIPQGIIDIVPSAELSPAQNVDEGKGDPLKYPYHDYLFRAFAEGNLTPEEILHWYANGELEKNIGCKSELVKKYFPTAQDFIADLERWWKQFTGMGIAKRIQSPPILAVSDVPYGANAESQNGVHFTKNYLELRDKLLAR